ncbi:MAG: hypothetical protein FWG40_12370 [Peptococcaceae bacterium]|nr:hypothetical protein [Peptococcaceae bacterium]
MNYNTYLPILPSAQTTATVKLINDAIPIKAMINASHLERGASLDITSRTELKFAATTPKIVTANK